MFKNVNNFIYKFILLLYLINKKIYKERFINKIIMIFFYIFLAMY